MDTLEVLDFLDKNKKDERIEKYLNSQFDSRVSKSIESFKTNSLPGLIESEIAKRTAEDPIAKKEAELDRRLKAQQISVDSGLPFEIVLRNIQGNDDDETAIGDLVNLVNQAKIDKATEIQIRGSFKPQASGETGLGQLSHKDIEKMKPSDVVAAMKRGLCDRILGRHQ
jgi:hypothetical protein